MNDALHYLAANAWIYVGSLAGSLVAMLAARSLNVWGRLQTLVVGTVAGCFAGPFVCELWFARYDPATSRVPSFVCFVCGMMALSIVPIAIRRIKDAASKWEFKVVRTGGDNEPG